MTHYYAYIRVSTTKQGEQSSSLQEQRAAIESYAARCGLTIGVWFEEQETAAKRGRAVFTKLIAGLKNGKARGLIVHKIDRSARNLRDWADLGELMDAGVEVHFAHENLDLSSRGGRLSADIQAVVAADYIRNLREEVRKGFYGRLKQGLYPLPAPFGYANSGKGKAKTIDHVNGPQARLIFELYATAKYTLDTLGPELERRGIRNSRGTPFRRSRLSVLLNDPFYIGTIRIRRTSESFQGIHQPLITPSLFVRVQRILSGRAKGRGIVHDYLYRKTIRCLYCTHVLIPERQKSHVYYRCHTSACRRSCIREDRIDGMLTAALQGLVFEKQEFELLEAELKESIARAYGNRARETEAVKLAIGNADSRLGRLTDAYIDRVIDKPLFEERKAALLQERVQLKETASQIEAGEAGIGATLKKFLELLSGLQIQARLAKPEEIRDTVKIASSNLHASGKNLVVTWVPLLQMVAERGKTSYGASHREKPRRKRAGRATSLRDRTKKLARRVFMQIQKEVASKLSSASTQ